MTTTPAQQPESLRLADALKMRTPYISGVSTIDHAEKELRRQHAEIARLMDKLEKERTARQEAQAMAECLDMLRTDLIAAGVVGPEVAPMFLTEAVLSAVSDAVAAERMVCAEIATDEDNIVDVPGYSAQLGDARASARKIEKAIRARGTA